MKNLFSIKNDISPLLKLAIPLSLTGLTQSAAWFFETIFLARLGPDILAAGSLVSWLFGTMVVILFGALSSINILVAHKHGEKDQEGIAHVARDGLILAALLTIPAVLLFWNMSPIFLLFGQSQTTALLAQSYLHALSWGMLANFMTMACLEVIIGIGHSRIILLFSILSVSLNIVWSYILIFGKWGFPSYGIAGAGWGLSVSSCVTACILVLFILINKNYRQYFRYIFTFTKPSFLLELLHIGLPMGVMYCVEVAFFFALTLCMGLISSDMQAANQIALQYLGLFMSMIFAIAQAVTVRMGHLLGAKEIYAAEKVNSIGIGIVLIIMTFIAILYWLFPTALISIDFDIHNPSNALLITEIKQLLAVSAVFQIIEAVRITLFGSLRGLKDTKFTLLTSIISFWGIALPLGYLLAMIMQMGSTGFWWGMVGGASLSVVMLQWRFKTKIRKEKICSEQQKELGIF
jgi:MATE family multidrug resistance protein